MRFSGLNLPFSGYYGDPPMDLQIYDTETRKLQTVSPMDGDTFRFYCCGPTVYGPAHIGNFRTFVLQDVFRRVIEATGLKTRHVRNLTDVDDKTIRESQNEGVSLKDFTDQWRDKFHADCEALGLLSPAVEPSAVEHIPEQIELIADLVEKGYAYQADDGSVYFDVSSFPKYGRLSRLSEREITTDTAPSEGERESSDEYDRDSAADFALWKAYRDEDGPNFWESPWGKGRPGWHIECSAMAMKHLGKSFDLHSGGVDLIFPHHENEIAQSEASTGQTFARLWFHVTHLMVDGAKMAKSLGNLYTLEDLAEKGFTAEELRYTLISAHYRQPLNFTLESMSASKKAIGRLRDFRDKLGLSAEAAPAPTATVDELGPFQPVLKAATADLNTPEALGQLFTVIKQLSRQLDEGALAGEELAVAQKGFLAVQYALGLALAEPEKAAAPQEVVDLAQQRWEAKQAKDWAAADSLRDQVTAAGWQIKDAPDGFELLPLS